MQTITPLGLALGLIPVAIVIAVLYRWSMDARTAILAIVRMLIQLALIGYLLGFIFESESSWLVGAVLIFMLLVASWIAMRPINDKHPGLFTRVLFAIMAGAIPTLVLVTQAIIDIQPWYQPRYIIPLGGMIFASAMNAVSLAAERFEAELDNQKTYKHARQRALQAALIPLINSLLAVGLVTLPGMMTGQILSGIEPLVASRYQIVVMCMIFGSSGIAAACYLAASGRDRNP